MALATFFTEPMVERPRGPNMFDDIFPVLYLVGLLVGSFVRFWYLRKYRQDRFAIFKREGKLVGFLASLWGIAILMPLVHLFTDWFSFANYSCHAFLGWLGTAVFMAGLWLLWRSHADLEQNWSVTLEIKEGHSLVTSGSYRYMRHPMYSAHVLWCIGQVLLVPNWLAGLASLVVFLPLYWLRVPREEEMMLTQLGEKYRAYKGRTGQIIPRFWQSVG